MTPPDLRGLAFYILGRAGREPTPEAVRRLELFLAASLLHAAAVKLGVLPPEPPNTVQ